MRLACTTGQGSKTSSLTSGNGSYAARRKEGPRGLGIRYTGSGASGTRKVCHPSLPPQSSACAMCRGYRVGCTHAPQGPGSTINAQFLCSFRWTAPHRVKVGPWVLVGSRLAVCRAALLCLLPGIGGLEWALVRVSNGAPAVVFWLGFWFWLGHLGAALGRFFASLAVVGAWGDHPPSGVVGGGPRVTWRCHWLCRADVSPWLGLGPIFFQGGSLRDEWLDRAGAGCRSWARRNWRGNPSAY